MKRIKILPLLVGLPLLLVAGCNGDNQVSPLHQRKFSDLPEVNTLEEVTHYGEKLAYSTPTTENARVFVVPVEFRDYPAEEIGKYYNSTIETKHSKNIAKRFEDSTAPGRGADKAREDIYKVYFGDAEDTQWESLKSYYEKSSYGQLHFNGIVAPWYRPYKDFEHKDEWASAAEWASNGRNAAKGLANELLEYYSNDVYKRYAIFEDEEGNQMFDTGADFLKYFDSNHDGCFDLIEIVYSAPFYPTDVANEIYDRPISEDSNEIFWAYCGSSASGSENENRPTISKYAFFSYYTFVECGKLVQKGEQVDYEPWTCEEISEGVPTDAHTLVHETGHALGLPDYYDTDYSGKNYAGSVDMMDHNVGDHNSYSKTQLHWVDPIVVTGPTQVTVRSFTETGDCIMVPYRGFYKDHEEYGNSSNIEYIAIELYTPTGVNKADSEHQYAGKYPQCPEKAGIKMYHVDSRLGVGVYNGGHWDFQGYTEKIVGTSDLSSVRVASTNSGNDRVEDCAQLSYIPKDSESMITLVTTDSLFQAGDHFNDDENYADFHMNETYKDTEEQIPFGYRITIKECSAQSATILFEAC